MTSRSSCEVSALATSSVVVPMLMKSEQPFGNQRRRSRADRFLLLGGDEAACFVGEVLDARGDDRATVDPRQRCDDRRDR